MRPLQIISGGQTGADRAALDWAIENGVPHGGWCPKVRKAEDGLIPAHYSLTETPSSGYLERNEANVRDAGATVIFTIAAKLGSGSSRTSGFAKKLRKPWIHLSLVTDGIEGAVARLAALLEKSSSRAERGRFSGLERADCRWLCSRGAHEDFCQGLTTGK